MNGAGGAAGVVGRGAAGGSRLDKVVEASTCKLPVVLVMREGDEDPLASVERFAEARRRRHVRMVLGTGQVRSGEGRGQLCACGWVLGWMGC